MTASLPDPSEAASLDALVLYWKWTVYPFVSEFRRQIGAAEQQQQQQQQQRQHRTVESPLMVGLRQSMFTFCDEVGGLNSVKSNAIDCCNIYSDRSSNFVMFFRLRQSFRRLWKIWR
jgi:hypothetical protein